MKPLSILLAFLFLVIGAAKAQKVFFKIKGSDTCLPLSEKEAEAFMKKYPDFSIMVVGGGSGVGFSSLLNGMTDIAQTSRKIKKEEELEIKDAGKTDLKEVIVAYDALSIIVNTANKVDKLTREQLEGIFTGEITNWKEVGGEDVKIVVYSRESSSGTYDFFKEHVLNNKDYSPTVILEPATNAIVESVSLTKGAIGYIGFEYLINSVKALEISYDKGKTYTIPSIANVKNKTYPIARPLYYYYFKSEEHKVGDFIKYVLSGEGQKIAETEGYVPIK